MNHEDYQKWKRSHHQNSALGFIPYIYICNMYMIIYIYIHIDSIDDIDDIINIYIYIANIDDIDDIINMRTHILIILMILML